ncbi:MAG TPA: lipopolysaccharide biosynthesis protein [Thermoplasmata archaeon]|nr:lipopolysaccharide biosynthesis protein [Thermoplasmata archaeon]
MVFATALAIQVVGVIGSIFLYKHIGINPTGQALLGTAQLFLLIGSSINGIGDLRIGAAYTYFLARGKAATDNTGTYILLRTMMVVAASVSLFVISPFAGIAEGAKLEVLGIFLCLPVLWSFSTVYNQMYIGLGNSLRAQFPTLVEALVRLPVLIYVAYDVRSLEGITLAYVIGASSSAIFSFSAVSSRIRRFALREATHLFRYAWPLMGGLMLNYLVTNMIPLVVSANLGPTQLSVFLTANGWRVLVLSVPMAVATPLFPYLAGLHRQERYELVRSGTWNALRYSAMLLVPGVVALVTYRYTFLNVFANRLYASSGAWPLAILVVAAIPLALSQIILSALDAIGRRRLELYITGAQVAVLIVAVGLLMPPWGLLPAGLGIEAAAIAVLLSGIAALTLNTYFMETLIRVHIEPLSIARITVSAALSFATLSFVNRTKVFPVKSGVELLAAVFLGFVVYFVLLAVFGELTKEDLRRIGSSLSLPTWLYEPLGRLCRVATTPSLAPVDLARAPGLRSPEFPEPFTGTTELPTMSDADRPEGEAGNGDGSNGDPGSSSDADDRRAGPR